MNGLKAFLNTRKQNVKKKINCHSQINIGKAHIFRSVQIHVLKFMVFCVMEIF